MEWAKIIINKNNYNVITMLKSSSKKKQLYFKYYIFKNKLFCVKMSNLLTI